MSYAETQEQAALPPMGSDEFVPMELEDIARELGALAAANLSQDQLDDLHASEVALNETRWIAIQKVFPTDGEIVDLNGKPIDQAKVEKALDRRKNAQAVSDQLWTTAFVKAGWVEPEVLPEIMAAQQQHLEEERAKAEKPAKVTSITSSKSTKTASKQRSTTPVLGGWAAA